MEIEENPINEIWNKFITFLDREMGFTLLFWLVIFLMVLVAKILGLGD
jgi:hypothetical protein